MVEPESPKSIISSILSVEEADDWEIIDSNPDKNLYLVHYRSDADMNKYGDLRGIVVDVKAKVIVSRSFGYTPEITADAIEVSPDQTIRLTDKLGNGHTLQFDRVKFKYAFEGTIIRAFFHDGEFYLISHRRLNISRSRWGKSITFQEMYENLGGPQAEELFDLSKKYSPYCHIFMVVHPDVLNVTKNIIGSGMLVYLGPKKMYDEDTSPYPQEEIDSHLWTPSNQTQNMNQARGGGIIYVPPNLTTEEVNHQLQYGFYDPYDQSHIDPRLWLGESIMIHHFDDQGRLLGLFKVLSTAYDWRSTMKGEDPNLLHRLYVQINGSYIDTTKPAGLIEYKRRYPVMSRYNVDLIIEHISSKPFVIWPQQDPTDELIKTVGDRLYNIWVCFLMSVPIHRQAEVSTMYNQLLSSRSAMIKWLIDLEASDDLEDPLLSNRVKAIISLSRSFANKRAAEGKNITRKGKKLSIKTMTRDGIRNLTMKENGSSVYQLVKTMERVQDQPSE